MLLASCHSAGLKDDPDAEQGQVFNPVTELRDCIPYVEPKPGDAAMGFSIVEANSGGESLAELWLSLTPRDFGGRVPALRVGRALNDTGAITLPDDQPCVLLVAESRVAPGEYSVFLCPDIRTDGAVDVPAIRAAIANQPIPEARIAAPRAIRPMANAQVQFSRFPEDRSRDAYSVLHFSIDVREFNLFVF
ncbi:MAG: hypothetical protein ACYTFV_09330 [Planctomycetota bacterium]|jgi:hypothetical protein